MIKSIIKNLRGLIAEDDSLSLGRVGLWIAFLPAIYIWLSCGVDINPYHFYTLVIFLAYNFSKKIPMFIKLIKAWKGIPDTEEKIGFKPNEVVG